MLLKIGLLFLAVFTSRAVDTNEIRFLTLAEFETGNNDRMIGLRGEISRYQILPPLWQRFAPLAEWENPRVARLVAGKISAELINKFVRKNHREPNPFEFYILWNAPAQLLDPSPHVSKTVAARSERYGNLFAARAGRAAALYFMELEYAKQKK